MKIHSNFQDYYDCALGSFLESDVVVNRKEKTEKVYYKEISRLGEFDFNWDIQKKTKFGTSFSYIPIHSVGFCGKWYFFVHEPKENEPVECNYYVYKTFDDIVENNKKHGLFGWDNKVKDYKDPNNDPYWQGLFDKFGPVLYIDEYHQPPLYISKNFLNKEMEITVWKKLKDLQFQKVKDPYTALWEIEHWFDSHARPDEAIVPVGDDITRLQAYGFDKKTSFRKAKEK